jgi:hypothetical protein
VVKSSTKKWLYEVEAGMWREVIRARVGCPKEAVGVRWVYLPPGILLPLGLVNTAEGCWIRVKLARIPGQATDLDVFFIEKTFYEKLKVEQSELGQADHPQGPPELLFKNQQYKCSSCVATEGCRSKTNCGPVNGKLSHVPRTDHRRCNAGGHKRSASDHH